VIFAVRHNGHTVTSFRSLVVARAYARAASIVVRPDDVFVSVRDPLYSPSWLPGYRYHSGLEEVYNRIPGFTAPAAPASSSGGT
jgi:hypothetical protein